MISPGTGDSAIHNSKSPGYYHGLRYHRFLAVGYFKVQGSKFKVCVCVCVCVLCPYVPAFVHESCAIACI